MDIKKVDGVFNAPMWEIIKRKIKLSEVRSAKHKA